MFECKAWLSDLSPYSNTEHLKFMEKKQQQQQNLKNTTEAIHNEDLDKTLTS